MVRGAATPSRPMLICGMQVTICSVRVSRNVTVMIGSVRAKWQPGVVSHAVGRPKFQGMEEIIVHRTSAPAHLKC
jgi:hypothetical protein